MEIKGTAVMAIRDFVKAKFPDDFKKWHDSLPADSKVIFEGPIDSTRWYEVKDAVAKPTAAIARLFYNDDVKKGAWESGRYSAETALKGIYKVFVKVSSPSYLIARASRVFATYYRPCEMKTAKNEGNNLVLHISGMENPEKLIEFRIGGWIEKALEISGSRDINVDITKSMARGDAITEFTISWT
jgi:hypothetical protein